MGRGIGVLVLLGLLAAACATDVKPEYVRDGVQYGVTDGVFRGRWWSYYERGTSFQAGGFQAEAESDFREALIGRSTDSWRARTYGLHFTEYFPNRELGITLYYQDRLDEAADYLDRSLAAVDTDRAHHYRDRVIRAKIARGIIRDEDDPNLRTDLRPGQVVSNPDLAFSIEAADDVGVSLVTVNDQRLYQRGSQTAVQFDKTLLLPEGDHEIRVAAVDLADRDAEEIVPVTVDLTGPALGLRSPVNAMVEAGDSILVAGSARDRSGVAEVRVNGRLVADGGGEERVRFETLVALEPGENAIIVSATDTAGNETRTGVPVYRGAPESQAAQLWLRKHYAPETLHLAAADGALPVFAAAPDTGVDGVDINIVWPQEDLPSRHNRVVQVVGEVITQAGLENLSLNDQPLELTGEPRESFNRRIFIEDETIRREGGRMQVAVRAEDAAGGVHEESVNVEVRPVLWDDPASKLPIALLPFQVGSLDPGLARDLWAVTGDALYTLDRFNYAARDLDALENLLIEQELSDFADPTSRIEAGRLMNVAMFFSANLIPYGDAGLKIIARAIETSQGTILGGDPIDIYISDPSNSEEVGIKCADLAQQMAAMFPRLSGEVTSIQGTGGQIFLDWTEDDGIRPNSYVMVVYEVEREINVRTGETELIPEPVGRAIIDRVSGTSTRARVVQIDDEEIVLEAGLPAITM